jgi:predicted porin
MKQALLGVLVGGIAITAAAAPDVTTFGLMDLGLVVEDGGPGGRITKLTSGVVNGSRLGFRGVEDLGGGLSALFHMEAGILADTGGSAQGGLLFGRQIFVGLAGKAGTVRLGRQYTFTDSTLAALDPFYLGFAGRMTNVFVQGYTSRFDNGITYSTPTVGGLNGSLAYGFGEVPGDSSAKRYFGAAAAYVMGPLAVRFAHQDTNTLSAILAPGNAKNTLLGATYVFPLVKIHAAYGVSKSDVGGIVTVDANDGMIGATVSSGASSFMASLVRRDDKRAVNGDARQIALGYTYAMSKRTALYAAYAHISNKNTAFYVSGNATEAGSGNRAANLGIRHVF